MKGFKKALALMMAVIMVAGVVNLPVKAATPMALTLNKASAAQDDSNKRYVIYFNVGDLDASAISAIGSGKKLTVYYGTDAKGYTSASRTIYLSGDMIFFTMAYASYFQDYGYVDANTVAADLDPMTFWIKEGTAIGSNYTVASDIKVHVSGSNITSGDEAPPVEPPVEPPTEDPYSVKLAYESKNSGAQDNSYRYLIYLTGATLDQMKGLHAHRPTLYIDGVQRTGTTTDFYQLSDTSFALLLQYNDLQSGAKTATEAGTHTVKIKAGTVVGNYTIAQDVILKVDKGTITEGTDETANEMTLSLASGSGAQDDQFRYLLVFSGASATQITALHQKKVTIYVDGEQKVDGATFWKLDSGELALLLKYETLEEGVKTAGALGEHMIEIKAGTEVGGVLLVKSFGLTLKGSSMTEVTPVTLDYVNYTDQNWSNMNRYYINLSVNGTAAPFKKNDVSLSKNSLVYIDGEAHTGMEYYDSGSGYLTLLAKYTDLEPGAATISAVGEHTLTIKRGTLIGGYMYVTESLTLLFNGASVQKIASVDNMGMNLKVADGTGYEEDGAYRVTLMPTEYLPGIIGETTYQMTVNINDAPHQVDATKTDTGALTFTIPVSALADAFALIIPAGEYETEDGTYGPIAVSEFKLYVNAYGAHTKGYYESRGMDVVLGLSGGTATEIALTAADSMTVTGTGGKLTRRVEDGASGVYYNGELTGVYLRKTAAGTWSVRLGESLITAAAGDSLIVTGAFATDTEWVDFATLSLTYNGSAWSVNADAATLSERTADISEDSFYAVPDNTVINDGAVTGAALSKSGVYTLKTDIGGAICEREVVLYKQGDINADNVMDVLDLIALKKNSQGLRDLNKSGQLASDLGGADVEENLKALRAKYLTNYTLKADEALPVGIVGQTGAGTYITDVQATKDGTAVYSVSDTENGYQVSGDTYEGVGLDYVLDFGVDRDLKILQLTDPQLIDSSQMRSADRLGSSQIEMYKPEKFEENAFYYIREAVEKAQPDIIFVTGDLVYGEFDDNGSAFLQLIEVMESLQIPWAPIYGNHDNESKMGVEWQCEQLMNAEYCLFNRRHSIGGNCNYSVGIAKNGSLERVMYMLDTHACWDAINRGDPVENRVGFTDAQLEWYRASALHVSSFAGREIPSFLCYHVPTTDVITGGYVAGYHDLAENATTFSDKYQIGVDKVAQPGDVGRHEERFKDAYTCSALLGIMQEVGTDGAFFAHSHQNNISVKYGGVRWTFGLKTSKYDRYPTDLGGVLVTLPSDGGEFTVQQVVVD